MKNVFKNLFAFLIIAAGVTSCDVGNDEELNYGNGSYVAQFPYAAKTAFFPKDDAIVYDYTMPVEIVGGNGLALTSDTAVSFEVDLVNSTAVQGLNFDFVGSTSLVIAANSTFASIPMKIYSGTLDDQNPPVLVLKLTSVSGSDNIVASGNKSSVAITLQGTCTSNLAGNYSTVSTRLTPTAGGPYTVATETITEIGDGTYVTQATGNFTLAAYGLTITGPWNNLAVPAPQGGYVFKEVCGRVAVEEQNLFDYYSNLVQQSAAQYAVSTVNPTTGVITIEYTVTFAAGNRNYKSIYTPLF